VAGGRSHAGAKPKCMPPLLHRSALRCCNATRS